MCKCNGCEGYADYKAREKAQHEARVADFEAWIAAGKPPMAEWNAMKGDRSYRDLTIAEAEALAVTAGAA